MKKMSKEKKYLLIGIIVLFFIGALAHFIFDLLPFDVIGIFVPVNESVFEHLKLILWPMILYWSIYYFKNKETINKERWFLGLLVSLVSSMMVIPQTFYFIHEGLNITSVVADIILFLYGLIIGQILGLHVYERSKGINIILSVGLIVVIIISFIIFTFYPPMLDFFKDSTTGKYGI